MPPRDALGAYTLVSTRLWQPMIG